MGLGLAALAGSAIYGAVRHSGAGKMSRREMRRAIAELRAFRPQGYTTPEDLRAAELTKGRLTAGARAQGELAGTEVARRSVARGLAGSPSEERSRARVNQQTALGVEHAGETAEEQLYNVNLSREAFERQKALTIFGAQTGAAQQEANRQSAEDAAYWNSLLEFTPTILGNIDTGGGSTASTGRRASTGFRPEQVPNLF